MRLELATISDDEWAFFLTKGQFIDEDNLPANPLPALLSNGVMSALVNLQQLPGFSGIMDSLSADADLWTAWCSDDNPQVRDCLETQDRPHDYREDFQHCSSASLD